MIRTNLATRPFYNERAVHATLALAAIVVVALTAFNAWRIITLREDQRDLNTKIAAADSQATELRAQAARIRQGLNPQELKSVSSSATEANTIIDRRLFSWTDLFNRLEATLPADARITAVRPQIDKEGTVNLSMSVMGRQYEDINQFIENLEGSGAFSSFVATEDSVNQDGLIQATLQGQYKPATAAPESAARR